MLGRTALGNSAVMLSEAKHLWLFRKTIGSKTDQRFFASLRMTLRRRFAIHFEVFFASAASVFKSGVRESGNRPNKFPSANAGSAFNRV